MTYNRAIARLGTLFVALFVLLALRQLWVQLIAAPHLADSPYNPREAALARYRGPIVASDGAPLALSGPRGRAYPLGSALAQALGYDSARYGRSGLEATFEGVLAARPVPSNPALQWRAIFAPASVPRAISGATVVSTIEPRVELALQAALAAYPRAAGVALDPRTGAVLALASQPSFDPETLDRTFPALLANPNSPLLDRALDGLYPPGSSFKIFTAAAALEDGVVSPASTFYDPGFAQIGDFVVHDNESEATGTQKLVGAFAFSSNVDFARIALALGSPRWFAAAARWKLGESLGFTLPVARDNLPTPADVTPSILGQLAFGQADLLVTPLRMALLGATIAAGGIEPRPYLVRAVVPPHGAARSLVPPEPLAIPISAAVAGEVRTLMLACVAYGTGTAAALHGVAVAGKTGTATNPRGRSDAWFVAFAPADAPRIAVAIVVENAGYGGVVAAPIARRVIEVALASDRR
ncbi:MAG: peptidoglycan D,D-transpeptidase FtsI family protein [Vulcanimicrobiaceae bacterium]